MIPTARAVDTFLTRLHGAALEQLQGIPEDDLNDWRPQQALGDVNTFFALATHLVGAGEYWILHAAGGQPLERDRPAEFRARGDLATLTARYDRWLTDCRETLARFTEADLGQVRTLAADIAAGKERGWTVVECLMHGVEHTAIHVGHLQIQRQIWEAEKHSSSG